MDRPRPRDVFLVLLLVLLLTGLGELGKGALFVTKHEGDTLHLLDIVGRMAAGERIHRDFMTPLGLLAFLPFSLFDDLGLRIGHALLAGQLLVAAVALPAVVHVVSSRLSGWVAWVTAIYLVALPTALTYGEADATMSMSMHYNRWAWVLAYLAILPAILPPKDRVRPALDGVVMGAALAALVLLKITYFIAFFPPVLLALLLRRAWGSIGAGLVTAAVIAAAVTAWGGIAYWQAYLGDLAFVAASPLRDAPGESLGFLLGSPAYLGINLALLAGVVLLRQSLARHEGLVLLTLLPGFVYVTYQNYGNDPQWLVLLVAVLWTLVPAAGRRNGWGWPMREAMLAVVAATAAFALPSYLSVLFSPWRHLALDTTAYAAIVPDNPHYADLGVQKMRYARVDGSVPLDGDGSGLEGLRTAAERDKQAVSINGKPLKVCELNVGLPAWYAAMAADLTKAGYAGKAIFEADLFNVLWLYGDFPQLVGAAPWYYGGAPGIGNARFVLVPDCPISPVSRKDKVEALAERGVKLAEVRKAPLYTLYRIEGPGE